jgi:CBS-domain-containing membrane protein
VVAWPLSQVGALATPILMASLAAPFFAYIAFGDVKASRHSLFLALAVGASSSCIHPPRGCVLLESHRGR